MQTLTMQGIANLAQVQRPVVSIWRTRFADSDRPFPDPEQEHPLRFDAAKVARWLQETGRGNNGDVEVESPLHSSAFERAARDLDGVSALLLLHQLRGEPLTDLDPVDAVLTIEAHEIESVLDTSTAMDALGNIKLRKTVDELAEAAFSGCRVLDRLVDSFVAPGGPWASEALTSAGKDLLCTVITEVQRAAPRSIVPAGPGGLLLANTLVNRANEHDHWTFGYRQATFGRQCDLVAWRHLAAQGFPIRRHDILGDDPTAHSGMLHLLQWQDVATEAEFFDCVEDLLVDLSDPDALIVVGPAHLMTDPHGDRGRRGLLIPSESYAAPLRYVARLPKGLSRFGGRRRLALWVFGRPSSTWTVVGSHSDTRTDVAAREAIAADVAAAISNGGDIHAHAFYSSTVLESTRFLRQTTLTAPATSGLPVDGGEQLARVWELDQGLLEGIDVAATPARPARISIARATGELGRDLSGARIPSEYIGTPETGWATVIGPEEVRNPALIGRRGIDRLTLETVAPRAKLTNPDDVIYVAAGGPAAIVDHHGGHAVAAPARIFRCIDAESDDRQLVPAVVAADIASQHGTDRRIWHLRTVPVEAVASLTEITRRTENRKQRLLDKLRDLACLEEELIIGLSAGSLTAKITTPDRTKVER
ncbi:DNA-binding protein [Rhodococcus hoagii]|nr:DNA-binding protein [Prescottella equi]